jgi:hypothetical protein
MIDRWLILVECERARAQLLLRRYDKTPKGKLDLQEFTELVRDIESGVIRSQGRGPAFPLSARVSAAFDAFDVDHSGFIENRKLRAALRHYGHDATEPPEKTGTAKGIKFRPLPGIFVFPSVMLLIFSLLITGLVSKSIALLVDPSATCTFSQCRWPGALILVGVGLFMLWGFLMLLHFWWYHYATTWEWLEPEKLSEVTDPLYLLVSKIRLRCCRGRKTIVVDEDLCDPLYWLITKVTGVRCCGVRKEFVVMDRVRGHWALSDDDTAEPERTERLLAQPMMFFRSRPGDALDAMKMLWLNRASGSNGVFGVFYEWNLMMVQLSIAALTGIGPALEPGSDPAAAQMYTVLVLQYGVALYLIMGGPSSDRIDNLVMSSMYLVEGTCTLLLLLQNEVAIENQPLIQSAVFYGLVLAMMIPILEIMYELFVVQLFKCMTNMKEVTATECCLAAVGVFAAIPGMVASLLGMDAGEGLIESLTEEVIAASAEAAEAAEFLMTSAEIFELAFQDASGGVGAVTGSLLWNLRQQFAANKIQALGKKRYQCKKDASTKIGARVRGHRIRDPDWRKLRERWLRLRALRSTAEAEIARAKVEAQRAADELRRAKRLAKAELLRARAKATQAAQEQAAQPPEEEESLLQSRSVRHIFTNTSPLGMCLQQADGYVVVQGASPNLQAHQVGVQVGSIVLGIDRGFGWKDLAGVSCDEIIVQIEESPRPFTMTMLPPSAQAHLNPRDLHKIPNRAEAREAETEAGSQARRPPELNPGQSRWPPSPQRRSKDCDAKFVASKWLQENIEEEENLEVRYREIVGLYTEVERLRESRMAIAEQLIAAQAMVDAVRAEQTLRLEEGSEDSGIRLMISDDSEQLLDLEEAPAMWGPTRS